MLGNDKSVIYKLWHSIIVMIYTKSKMTTSLKITNCNLETPYKANYKIWHAFFIPFVLNYKVCRTSFLENTWKIIITLYSAKYQCKMFTQNFLKISLIIQGFQWFYIRFGRETIYPTKKFTSISLLQMSCRM